MGVQVGRGLEALIRSDVTPTQVATQETGRRQRIRQLEEQLLDVKVRITAQRKELEGLRKDLTIKLMLNGKVDKTPLIEAEDALTKLIGERDRLTKEVEALRAEEAAPLDGPKRTASGPTAKGTTFSTDLDIRMVRELLKDEGTPIDGGSGQGPPGDRAYVDKLKEELSPRKEAQKLREEAGRGQNAYRPPAPLQPSVAAETPKAPPRPVATHPVPEPTRQVPAATGAAQRTMSPKRVRVKLGTVRPAHQPKDKDMYEIIDRAITLMETGDPGSSKELLLKALSEYPMDDELLYHLGNAFFMLGDLDNAELRFRKAVERNPASFRALNNLGIVLRKKGKREQAIRALNQSLEVNNRYERAWFNLGTIFMEIEAPLLKEAQIFLKRALECDPNYHKAREKLAEVERMLQKAS